MDEKIYGKYFEQLIKGNKKGCDLIVSQLLDVHTPVQVIYEKLFQRSLYEIGSLWETNKISVAVEHLATSITERLMTRLYPIIFKAEKTGNQSIICCIANEYHQIGARMVADTFELCGWDSYFLGANTPDEDLLDMIEQKHPDVLGLSLSIYFNIKELVSVVEKVRTQFPGLDIMVGGQAFRLGGKEILNRYKNVSYIGSLFELKKGLKEVPA